MKNRVLLSAFALTLAATAMPAHATELLQNGNFSSGLTGWTSYVTSVDYGTISPTTPNSGGSPYTVQQAETASFNVTGSGTSNALWLNAGEYQTRPGQFFGQNYEGGGVSQIFTSLAGLATFTADIAFWGTRTDTGGIFSVLLDGVALDAYDFGTTVAGTTRNTLSFSTNLSAGQHTLQLQVVRPYGPAKDVRGQYFDNVTLDQVAAVPEPATWAMMITGFGFVGGAMRRKAKVSVRFA
ncbi:PEPxxWA-CTERM sorting domain-containing protein [Sphingobium boeckii]|uniref:Ice-binding protein C-terminal domain-containing protein n=1 Tax=Sphingobium boeckii TaxID=1082345 RepID=A0A7W9AK80_9SPHN|nr:PEPxxWA-CTERM sorting domain-containing protein [Sphingobium boeckii]MBB5687190.1 hypothetical protein [Sphingobium boeckii]